MYRPALKFGALNFVSRHNQIYVDCFCDSYMSFTHLLFIFLSFAVSCILIDGKKRAVISGKYKYNHKSINTSDFVTCDMVTLKNTFGKLRTMHWHNADRVGMYDSQGVTLGISSTLTTLFPTTKLLSWTYIRNQPFIVKCRRYSDIIL